MATREENLKKINDELEKLTDEELDDVAGGQIIWRNKINDEKASAQQNQNNNQNNITRKIFYDRP